jgi:predicted AAA+ superfamily ATPase
MSQRYLESIIQQDALSRQRMAFVAGPRQVGKTTMARSMLQSPQNYYSWDDPAWRRRWTADPLAALNDRGPGLIVLDELHKDPQWKDRLKGFYDMRGDGTPIVVTGSARLDVFRRGGDSLMGRYLPYRLHPFTVGERTTPPAPVDLEFGRPATVPWQTLMQTGGFPEPLFDGSPQRARRWSRLRAERLVNEEVRDLRNVRDLRQLKLLVTLLPERVGSLLSINGLAEQIGTSFATVRDWVDVLSELYVCTTIYPWSRRVGRALTSTPKLYMTDILSIPSDGARRENLAALHLLKACQYWTDVAAGEFDLWYLRTRDGAEVDFVVTRDGEPWMLVECKSGDTSPAAHLRHFARELKPQYLIQLVSRDDYDREYAEDGLRVMSYDRFFAALV